MTARLTATEPRADASRMDEDELLTGLLDAAAAGGWLVHHIRRSDLGLQQGHSGWPDIVAAHRERRKLVVIECKSATGRVEPWQEAWLRALRAAGVDARVVRPAEYDATWRWLVGDRLLRSGRR